MFDSNMIERQEAEGQRLLVRSDTLPTDIGRYSNIDAKAILEAAGLKFLGDVEGDPMFQRVELPLGWKKVPTNHSMWSDLVDDKGRQRASIFYKAASYDRSAHMSLTSRYSSSYDYDRQESESVAVANVYDCRKVIYTTDSVPVPTDAEELYRVKDEATKAASKWLDDHFPDWRNPGAYWD